MKRFSRLYLELDMTTSTNAKVDAMVSYFAQADDQDAAWALFFLSGQRIKRPIKRRLMGEWACELVGIPDWLFEESYSVVGDLAETIALLVDQIGEPTAAELPLHVWTEERALKLKKMEESEQREALVSWWSELRPHQLFVFNKLLTGAMRVGVSKKLVLRALSKLSGIDAAVLAHRLMGKWEPTPEDYRRLFDDDTSDTDISRPYPYFLASPLEEEPRELGDVDQWIAEWKWDGIRGQLIRRDQESFLWSRGEELVTAQYPELEEASKWLPDGVVLDGEVLAFDDGFPLPFGDLQRRIGRKRVSKKILEEVPVSFVVYDIMEFEGEDIREAPLDERRATLERVLDGAPANFQTSTIVRADSWDELAEFRAESRDRRVEGLMLKRRDSPYRTGRKRGDWWKWKVEPYHIDAVLIYAQAGRGKRANLFTDYTFAVWTEDEELVPIAKAYSGLSNKEIKELDSWIRKNTLETYGPVRAVEREHVFEISFEGIAESNRHKSGIAVRFPRITRWRKDLGVKDADQLGQVRKLLYVAE